MRILKVIHGYPMRYNAGSEVYSQMLCHALANRHEVHVFTREENPFKPDYIIETEADTTDSRIKLHVMNLSGDRHHYQYQHPTADQKFTQLLDKIKPDIVHIGHLNHLSTSIVYAIKQQKIPILFTLHDYWLMCPRGQFMQRNANLDSELWAACTGQDNKKCAIQCYSGCLSGAPKEQEQELNFWEQWVARRMDHTRDITQLIDHFVAPSRYLYQRFVDDFQLPKEKITYLDYGFDLQRFAKARQRLANEPFTFGYIGTHIPAKGIQHLIQAFSLMQGNCLLRIWGRPNQNTASLKALAASCVGKQKSNIEWLGEYCNNEILSEVFNKVDCIVVPSIWVENSPLVIHEALQARVPVITANVGGMAEYITHEVNGLLFEHRNSNSLAQQMQILLDNPVFAKKIGSRGYLLSPDNNIPDLVAHVQQIESLYYHILVNTKETVYANI